MSFAFRESSFCGCGSLHFSLMDFADDHIHSEWFIAPMCWVAEVVNGLRWTMWRKASPAAMSLVSSPWLWPVGSGMGRCCMGRCGKMWEGDDLAVTRFSVILRPCKSLVSLSYERKLSLNKIHHPAFSAYHQPGSVVHGAILSLIDLCSFGFPWRSI